MPSAVIAVATLADRSAASIALAAPPPVIPAALRTIDGIIAGSSVLVVLAWAMNRWRARSRNASIPPPRVGNTLREDALAIAAGAYLLTAFVLSGLTQAVGMDTTSLAAGLIVSNGAQIAGIVACLAIASRRITGGAAALLVGPAPARLGRAAIWVVGSLIVALGVCPVIGELTVEVMRAITPTFEIPLHPTLVALRADHPQPMAVALLWAGALLVAPLAEELFFRGILQTLLTDLLNGSRAAIAVTAIAFGLVHFNQPHAVVALVVLGVLIGYVYRRTGSLLVAVALHTTFNLKTLVWDALSGG